MRLPIYAGWVFVATTLVSGAAFHGSPSKECRHTTCQHAQDAFRRQPHNFCYDSPLRAECNTHQDCDHCKAIARELNANCNHEFCPHPPQPPHTVFVTKPLVTITKTDAPVTVTKKPITITNPAVAITKAAITVFKTVQKPAETITKAAVTTTESQATITEPALTITASALTITQAALTITESPVTVTQPALTVAKTVIESANGIPSTECPILPTIAPETVTLTVPGALASCPTTCLTQSSTQSTPMRAGLSSSVLSGSSALSANEVSQASLSSTPASATLAQTPSLPISDEVVSASLSLTASASASIDQPCLAIPSVLLPLSLPLSLLPTASVSKPATMAPTTAPGIKTVSSPMASKSNSAKAAESSIVSAIESKAAVVSSSLAAATTIVEPADPITSKPAAITTSISGAVSSIAPAIESKVAVVSSSLVAATTIIEPADPVTSKAAAITTIIPAFITTSVVPVPATTTSVCIPSPTQAIQNPSFEDDLAGTGTYTFPWVFSGIGNVQSNTNNAYQSYDGTHFGVLYGRYTSTTSMSQALTSLVPGTSYALEYYYNIQQASPQAICKLTVTVEGQVVDTITSTTIRTGRYLSRSASYTPTAAEAVLQFTLVCPRFLQLTAQSNYALDAITFTSNNNGCGKMMAQRPTEVKRSGKLESPVGGRE